jgi:hypothetical protein
LSEDLASYTHVVEHVVNFVTLEILDEHDRRFVQTQVAASRTVPPKTDTKIASIQKLLKQKL